MNITQSSPNITPEEFRSSIYVVVVINALTLIIAALKPLIESVSFFIKHVKKSKCLNTEVEVAQSPTAQTPENKTV